VACMEIDSTDRRASEPKARLMYGLISQFPEAATRGRARFCRFLRGCNAPARRVWRCLLAEGPSLRYADTVGMPSASKRKGRGWMLTKARYSPTSRSGTHPPIS